MLWWSGDINKGLGGGVTGSEIMGGVISVEWVESDEWVGGAINGGWVESDEWVGGTINEEWVESSGI